MPSWLKNRDWMLLFLLAALNIASAYTTVLGARQILPPPMGDIIGISVQTFLFMLLGGFAMREAPFRRWFAVFCFAAASIYTSFFSYYEQLAKDADQRRQLSVAQTAHAEFVSQIYTPNRIRVEGEVERARTEKEQAIEEAELGTTTGIRGFGPKAKAMIDKANAREVEARSLLGKIEAMRETIDSLDVASATPEEIFEFDTELWQNTPAEWKMGIALPDREDYIDVGAQVALLTPYNRIVEADQPALVSLFLAMLVDGIAIFLGTAIEARQRPMLQAWSENMAGMISQFKKGQAMVKTAFESDGRDAPTNDPNLDDALQIVDVRVSGSGSEFLTTFYQAIHPETGALDYSGLQRHTNPSYRIAARMLIDQLRSPELGWVVVENGRWTVSKNQYAHITAWLGEQIRRESEYESKKLAESGEGLTTTGEAPKPERTLRLVIPA